MKKLSILILSILSVFALSSCSEKELGPVANTSNPGSPSITSPESGQSYQLNRDQADDTLMTIQWSEPDFGFAAAPTYTVEMGVSDNNFENPMELASVQGQTSLGVTVNNINTMLLTAGLSGGVSHSLDLRVLASVSDSVSQAISEPVTISITPFQTDFPPIYMIGSAINGWSLDAAQTVPSTEPNIYSTRAQLTNSDAFRFFTSELEDEGWSAGIYNYPYFADNGGNIDELLVNAQDGDSNFQFTGTTGWYRVTVNMDNYSVQLEEAEEPIMYMTGAGIGGWDQPGTGESVKMTYIQDGVFEATTEFNADGAFRFFGQAGWGPTSYNYPYFADNDGTIPSMLINAEDGDSNFQFTGSTGDYYIKVNINDYTIEMSSAN